MGKTGTLWRESLRTSFQGRTIERKGSYERSGKNSIDSLPLFTNEGRFKRRTKSKEAVLRFFVSIKVLTLAAIFAR